MNEIPVYDIDDAIDFISLRSNIPVEVIEQVLLLDEDYMRSVGIIQEG